MYYFPAMIWIRYSICPVSPAKVVEHGLKSKGPVSQGWITLCPVASWRQMPKLSTCAPFLPRRGPRSLLWWWSWKHHKQHEEWSQEPRFGWQQRELLEILYRSDPTTTEGIQGFTVQGRQDQRLLMKASTNILDTTVLTDCLGSGRWGCSALLSFCNSALLICFMGGQWPPSCLTVLSFPLSWLQRLASNYRFLSLLDVPLSFLGN